MVVLGLGVVGRGLFGGNLMTTQFWGLCLTFFSFFFSLTAKQEGKAEDKYEFLASWKWYTVMFELAFTWMIVSACFVWFVVGEPKNKTTMVNVFNWFENCIPLIALIVDYFTSCQPFVMNHIIVIMGFDLAYFGVVLAFINTSVNPYPAFFRTDSFGSWVKMGTIFLAFPVIFVILEYLTRKKLAYQK